MVPTLLLAFIAAASGFMELPGFDTTFDIVKAGTGEPAITKGTRVQVHATGVVEETGKKFWSTKDPGQQPFEYDAGIGGVITGWDQGCLGMKMGEVRKLRIPAHEGCECCRDSNQLDTSTRAPRPLLTREWCRVVQTARTASRRGASLLVARSTLRLNCSRSPNRSSGSCDVSFRV